MAPYVYRDRASFHLKLFTIIQGGLPIVWKKNERSIFVGKYGGIWGDTNLEIMYYIYSDKEDVEKVKNIAYEIIRQVNGP